MAAETDLGSLSDFFREKLAEWRAKIGKPEELEKQKKDLQKQIAAIDKKLEILNADEKDAIRAVAAELGIRGLGGTSNKKGPTGKHLPAPDLEWCKALLEGKKSGLTREEIAEAAKKAEKSGSAATKLMDKNPKVFAKEKVAVKGKKGAGHFVYTLK